MNTLSQLRKVLDARFHGVLTVGRSSERERIFRIACQVWRAAAREMPHA